MKDRIPTDRIERVIFLIRGQKVILDDALSRLYGVTTKRLNEQVKRNRKRFPRDFIFQLKLQEVRALRSHFATLNPQPVDIDKHSPNYPRFVTNPSRPIGTIYRPWAFTEHGAIMAAMVLQSPRAVEMSVHVVRAFVRLRELLATNKDLAQKLAELERRVESHDVHIQSLFEAIRRLMAPDPPKPRRIGFRAFRQTLG
jgi:ORF6N domain-containing protein